VVQEFSDPRVSYSVCCGSARLLLNGHWLMSWGAQSFMTELDSHGVPVFTVHYDVPGAFSYRAFPVDPGEIAADVLRDGMDAMAAVP
jgi:hypothetical protein